MTSGLGDDLMQTYEVALRTRDGVDRSAIGAAQPGWTRDPVAALVEHPA